MRTSVRHQGDASTTVMIVVDDGTEVVVGRVDARRPDLALVDALVRLQLTARRRGWLMRVRDVSEELRSLLEFVGLAEVLALEPRREPELGEELGVQEVVQPDDPPA
jgi:anti-anti-sigma regulatory factor